MSDNSRRRPTSLAEHGAALPGLLESLLAEVPAVDAVDTAVAAPSPSTLKADDDRPLIDDKAAVDRVPAWAATDFRALLFSIGPLRFAVPLVLMRSIAHLPGQRTQVPGQPVWHLGVVRYRGRSVVVADLGALIGIAAHCNTPRYLLVIGEGGEALVCDRVEDMALVTPDSVRWRRPDGTRAWLAGMLSEQMCALLDPDVLAGAMRHG